MKQVIIGALFLVLNCFFCLDYGLADASLESKKVAQEIYQEFLSPFCPGRALGDCPSSSANRLKDRILDDLNAGKSKQEVFDSLVQEFGEEYSSKPDLSGFSAFAWLVPIMFFALLVLVGYKFVIRWST